MLIGEGLSIMINLTILEAVILIIQFVITGVFFTLITFELMKKANTDIARKVCLGLMWVCLIVFIVFGG